MTSNHINKTAQLESKWGLQADNVLSKLPKAPGGCVCCAC